MCMKLCVKVSWWTVSRDNIFPIIRTFCILYKDFISISQFRSSSWTDDQSDRGPSAHERRKKPRMAMVLLISVLIAHMSGGFPNLLSKMTTPKLCICGTVRYRITIFINTSGHVKVMYFMLPHFRS